MLWIVLELHHPQLSIRTQHQLALCPAPHPPNCLHRRDRHCKSPTPSPYRIRPSSMFDPRRHLCPHRLCHRHRHHQVIMRSIGRSRLSALSAYKCPALSQAAACSWNISGLCSSSDPSRARHLRLRYRRRQPAWLPTLPIDRPIPLRSTPGTPIPQPHDCSAPPQSAHPSYSFANSTATFANSFGLNLSCNSAHCNPVSRSITCTAAKSPSSPPPAESTATMYSRPSFGGNQISSAPPRRIAITWLHLVHPSLNRLHIEEASPGRPEAGRRILRKLLRSQASIASLQPSTKPNLLCAQPVPFDQPCLHIRHALHVPAHIRRLHPPRQKVPHQRVPNPPPHPRRRTTPRRTLHTLHSACSPAPTLHSEPAPHAVPPASPPHRPASSLTSLQCRFCTLSPRPAPTSHALATRYSLSSSGNTICPAFARLRTNGPSQQSPGSSSHIRCTMRKIDSAASCVCATCSVSVPGLVIVRRKNRAATQVVIPICLAFSTMFCRPRRSSNLRCAAFGTSAVTRPSRFRTRSTSSAVLNINAGSRSSRSPSLFRLSKSFTSYLRPGQPSPPALSLAETVAASPAPPSPQYARGAPFGGTSTNELMNHVITSPLTGVWKVLNDPGSRY